MTLGPVCRPDMPARQRLDAMLTHQSYPGGRVRALQSGHHESRGNVVLSEWASGAVSAGTPSNAGSPDNGGFTAATSGSDVVEVTIPALASYLGIVRTATAGLAARLGFSLDEIEDLRIAVDEACVMLLGLPGPQPSDAATLTCQFQVETGGALAVTVSAQVSPNATLPAEQSFMWQVLTAHATDVAGHVAAGRAVVELFKRRRAQDR